ncbi:MAG: hypothetical protein ACWGNB_07080 [Thiogranum sp.]
MPETPLLDQGRVQRPGAPMPAGTLRDRGEPGAQMDVEAGERSVSA